MDNILDAPVTTTDEERVAAKAEYARILKERTARAESDLRGDTAGAPDVIYSGLQEAGRYSADPTIDADPNVIRRATSLNALVKEYSVSPGGDWELTLSDLAIQAVKDGKFCTNCLERQPEDEHKRKELKVRLEGLIGPAPDSLDRCCFCGDRLGIHGTKEAESATFESFTHDQLRVIEMMFGDDPFNVDKE